MKITKKQLSKIIKEELEKMLFERHPDYQKRPQGVALTPPPRGEYPFETPGAGSAIERDVREPKVDHYNINKVQADVDAGMSCEDLRDKHGDGNIYKWQNAGGKLPDGGICIEPVYPPEDWRPSW